MIEYHKIDTVFKRDPNTHHKTLLLGEYSDDAFSYLAVNDWFFTEKVDGMNIRVMVGTLDPSGTAFAGKSDNASLHPHLIARLQERFHPQAERLGEMFPAGACLYGEGYGAGIQKGGGNYRQDKDFVLFDVLIGDLWLARDTVEDIAGKLGLDVVPVIGRGTLLDMVDRAQCGFNSQWGDFKAEGIVARPTVELRNRRGGRVITKIKYRDF